MIWTDWSEHRLEILLIEDDPLEAELLYEFVKHTSVTMWRESRLANALDNLSENSYDLILLDTTLPDAEDVEALAQLRESAPQTPVLVLGVLENDAQALRVVRAGAQDYLVKPTLTRSTLMRALTYAVERQALQSEAESLKAQAESVARRKEQFASMVSHEILNPMTGLLGFARLMGRTELNAKQREYLKVITDCTTSLSVLVSDLLELSRLEEGRESVRKESFSLFELTDELGTFLSQDQTRNDVRLLLVTDPSIPTKVRGDRVKVRQILYNLAQNALKFTETGHVAIRLKRLVCDGEDLRIRLMVEDSGRGIPPEKRDQIFEPFTQVQGKDRSRGHGLGLAICAEMARVMGSRLKLESEIGHGTIFWMDLSLSRCPDATNIGRVLEGKSVLACSDYEPERLAFREIFEGLGARVHHSNPNDFVTGSYDVLVVSDMMSGHAEILERSRGKVDRRLLVTRTSDGLDNQGYLNLPAPLRVSQLTDTLEKPFFESAPTGNAGRALVVEDDPVCRAYLNSLLSHLGFQVDTANDDEEAYAWVSRRKYKVLTLDGHLPGGDGPSVYRRMMREGWLSSETAVLIISGDPDLWKDNFRGDDAQVHLLSKPVCPDTVQRILTSRAAPSRWDAERLRALDSLGPDAARMLFETFEGSVPDVLDALQGAVDTRCATTVRKLSHQLKGAAASVGAADLARHAGALEISGGHPERWENLLEMMRKEFARATEEMKVRQRNEVPS